MHHEQRPALSHPDDSPWGGRGSHPVVAETVTAGEYVTRQGEHADHVFFRYSGEFEVLVAEQGPEPIRVYNALSTKQHMGELALLYRMPRFASIRCTRDGVLFTLDRDTFMDIVT